MNARLVAVLLLALLGILHGQLWWGRGSVPQVNALREELTLQTQANQQAQLRNEQLANEVRDLREGLDMVEEMARQELGMVKPNEIFVHVQRPPP
ncbi:septum formation initiator family protein [Aquabacterium sp. A08]|uniref:FtsB family cell division protein n=1 Tax=Aquabacterium sp. A08 TaxID=2718532 RepID=UPI001421A00B|nr:septum formation initiator family protein [Aquabacterium sp. A08]NIC40601.1 septation ring formation regulator EzrA [Aquabacterium sp. A08]